MKRINPLGTTILPILAALGVALAAVQSFADTVTLNNGIVHEGTLISETPEEIRFEVGKSVKQIRTFKRGDIKELVVIPPDQVAITGIRELVPSADLLEEGAYRRMIEGAPKVFLTSFPSSPLVPEVKKIIATLEEERQKVIDGDVKLDGKWITKESIDADPYNHKALVQLAKINSLLAGEEYLDAFRSFDALEKAYPESTSYPQAVTVIKGALTTYSPRVATQLAKSTRDNKRRETDYSRMREDQRAKAEAAYKRQLDPFLKQHAADRAAKKKWLDFHIWDLASIADAQTEAKAETTRLDKLDVAALSKRAAAIAQAAALANAEKYEEAWVALKPIGKFAAGSHAEKLKDVIAEGTREATEQANSAKAEAERAEKMRAREAAAAARVAKAKEENISKPIPSPAEESTRPVTAGASTSNSSDSDSDDSDDYADEDGINFDRTGGEEKKSSGGGLS
ncbi:MAG: PTPDL family protein, partial [Verrucomicrobiales bacterium]